MSETTRKSLRWMDVLGGAILGGLVGLAMDTLDLNVLLLYFQHLTLGGAIAGALVGGTRWRGALWVLGGTAVLALLVIAYTPLANWLTPVHGQADPLEHVDAVVVLAGGFVDDGVIGARGEDRLVHGLELVKAGWAPRLAVTEPGGPQGVWSPEVRKEMTALGIDVPLEAIGPVVNTHDEALAVAKWLKERGLKRIILVTNDWHMPRAAALFTRAGVSIVREPCLDSTYDQGRLETPGDRLAAMRDWLHEAVGRVVYRERGWI